MREAACLAFCQRIFDLVDLNLTEALDLEQVTASGCVHGGNGVVAIGLKLHDVRDTNAVRLDCLDVDNVAILLVRSVHLAEVVASNRSRHCVSRHWRLRKAC